METRSIAFKCTLDRIHSSICRLHAWQDVLSDHARSGVVPKERFVCDLRQPSTRTKLVESMCFKRQRSTFIIKSASGFRKCGGKRTLRLPRSMKVKVVQSSESHVMRLLSFLTPERTPKTTANEVKARELKEKDALSRPARSRCISPSHRAATPSHML